MSLRKNHRQGKKSDRRTLHATGCGDVEIELPKGLERTSITLQDTLYVSNITFTLISTMHIVNAGMSIIMEKG
ncbi:hypothetical protein BDN67DRAFT_917190, partial [Paxillus ammoniavirescens]